MSDKIDWPKWVRSWPCIDKGCDGKGTICRGEYQHPDGEIEYDLEQCQFCYERDMLADLLVANAAEIAELKSELSIALDAYAIIDRLEAENEKLRADERRMDYLESEAIREIDLQAPRSLFRRNVPITREAVDRAIEDTRKEASDV